MTAKKQPAIFVWTWLPDETKPTSAGLLTYQGDQLQFRYSRTYLSRPNAISLFDQELPLVSAPLLPSEPMKLANCFRDSLPGAWGQTVLQYQFENDNEALDEETLLLETGSDRGGALDFQLSGRSYAPRHVASPSLADLYSTMQMVEENREYDPDLAAYLVLMDSLGGMRPKSAYTRADKSFIVKFTSASDERPIIQSEFIAMRLARLCQLNVAPVTIEHVGEKPTLLIERFDRIKVSKGWARQAVVSGLTLLGLDEMMARYASYEGLASIIEARSENPSDDLRELFGRMVFNVLCGNTDDHARNHSVFWFGARHKLALTPAYDICPQIRTGGEASQAMSILKGQNQSSLDLCFKAAKYFKLDTTEAKAIICAQIRAIKWHWVDVCDEASLSEEDQESLWGRQFLNPFCYQNAPSEIIDAIREDNDEIDDA